MRRLMGVLAISLFVAVIFFPILSYGEEGQHQEMTEEQAESVEVGNKICPVSDEEIKEDEVVKVEHEGKIYNLCCKMCAKDFKKDPEKYIEKLEQMEENKDSHHSDHQHH